MAKVNKAVDTLYHLLKELKEKKAKLEALKLKKEKEKMRIEEKFAVEARPYYVEISRLEKEIEKHCEKHREEIFDKDKKSWECKWGKVGFKETPVVVWIKNKNEAIELLKNVCPSALRYYAEIDKIKLRELYLKGEINEEQLGKVIKFSGGEEKFYITVEV